jgi:hypothetical protein
MVSRNFTMHAKKWITPSSILQGILLLLLDFVIIYISMLLANVNGNIILYRNMLQKQAISSIFIFM